MCTPGYTQLGHMPTSSATTLLETCYTTHKAPLPAPMGVSTGESPPLVFDGRLMEWTSKTLVFLAQNQWFWKARKVFSRSWPRVSAARAEEG